MYSVLADIPADDNRPAGQPKTPVFDTGEVVLKVKDGDEESGVTRALVRDYEGRWGRIAEDGLQVIESTP